MSTDKLIVISTHILEEVEAVCSRAIIIADGRILADDTPQQLAMRSRYHNAVTVALAASENFDEVRSAIDQLPSVETTESDRVHRTLTAIAAADAEGANTWREVSDLATDEGWDVTSLQLEAGRLDEVFRAITGGAEA